MKKFEIIVPVLLIMAGLLCLTMSVSFMLQPELRVYMKTFVQICLWMGVPILFAGIYYLLLLKKRDK